MAAAVESASDISIAQAIVREAERSAPLVEVTDFSSTAGHGVTCTVEGARVTVGRPAGDLSTGSAGRVHRSSGPGRHPRRGRADRCASAGVIAVRDTVKPTSAEAVRGLKDLGLTVAADG